MTEKLTTLWPGLDHIANFINALDSEGMTAKDVRTAIYAECLAPKGDTRPSDRNDVIEECAKVADGYRMKIIGIPSACIDDTAEGIAKAIRARKDQEHG